MSVYSPEYHAMVFSPSPAPNKASTTTSAGAATVQSTDQSTGQATDQSTGQTGNQHESFFHHLLDVINPLQHIPVIGTIYRAITGEHIGAVEKIAGDTLYGGLWGAVSSIADVAFEGLTGKSAEDTVISWFKSGPSTKVAQITAPTITVAQTLPSADVPTLPPSSLASVAPAEPANPQNSPPASPSNTPDIAALSAALSARGITGDIAARALAAYRRAIAAPPQAPVFATIN